jgi:hypothetical protein
MLDQQGGPLGEATDLSRVSMKAIRHWSGFRVSSGAYAGALTT